MAWEKKRIANIRPFEEHLEEYERWFVENRHVYQAELAAVRRHIPEGGYGLEIGVGTGRFAEPLKIQCGIEPSDRMRRVAAARGIETLNGVAEDLPFEDDVFDFAVLVTTICFVEDVTASLREARRVVRPGGRVVVGFVDSESSIGRFYQKHQKKNVFYRYATFYSTTEVRTRMEAVGIKDLQATQTIFGPLEEITEEEEVREGWGKGSFVALSGHV